MSARRWIGAFAVLALTVVGCGGSDSDEGAADELRVAYIVAGSGELLTLAADGGERRSHRGGWWPDGGPRALSSPAWSPDGKRLAYFEWASPRGKALYVDYLNGERRAVTEPLTGAAAPDLSTAPPQGPLWSPDGQKLAFRSADANVRVIDVDGGDSWTVPTRRLETGWCGIGLAWAPDGERLAVTIGWGPHEGTWIAEKGRLRRFRPQDAIVRDPAWSPDGKWIAYSHDDGRGTDQIYISDPDAVHTIRVTNDLARERGVYFSNSAPTWSPDGSALAFLSNREGRHSSELFVAGADGFAQRRLTRGVAVTRFPEGCGGGRTAPVRWSPDGQRLAFLGWGWYAHPRIGVVDVDGGGLRRLAPAPLDDGYLAAMDLSWVGEPDGPEAHVQVPSLPVPERRIAVARDHLPEAAARLGRPRVVLRVPIDKPARSYDEYVDVSPDGASLSFLRRLDQHRFEVGVLDLRDGLRRVLTLGATTSTLERGGRFSPTGRTIVFRRWSALLTVDVETGEVRRPADRAGEGPISWLADGRVTFLDAAGRLRLGGDATVVRTGKWRAVAVSPDGRLAVVRAGCRAVLVNVRSGERKPLGWGLLPDPGSWSPNGSLIAVHRPEYDECRPRLGTKGGDVVVFDRAGREVGTLLGTQEPYARGAALHWTRDSRKLLAAVEYSGTRTPPTPLYVFSAADRTVGKATADLGRLGTIVGTGRSRVVFLRYVTPDTWQFAVARP